MKLALASSTVFFLILFALFIFRHEKIETKIVINQPIDRVWQLFTDTQSYPEWNTLFDIDKFPTHVGQQINVDLYDEDRNVQFQMKPEIKKINQYHLEWEGKLYINGLFNGRHKFVFTKIDANTTELIQSEDFNGLLVPLLNYFVIRSTQLKFDRMNTSFKKYVENQ
jgi:hypothetical protein